MFYMCTCVEAIHYMKNSSDSVRRGRSLPLETTPKTDFQRCPPSRQGKKMIFRDIFDKDVHRQLKMLALEKDTSISRSVERGVERAV